ncbi:hypothetical protein LWI28_014903 [Acer negundo]|uniref:BSD domain-containing protein n=1 Tax=Acer negundo TaxID=4023 RepID=A0AAD5IZE9_ACENE|nr:hypothetical protein LWI28_014903 [Acer negundo]KAK4842643.1 hypothetical protein QYF36_025234 [Acer negundo]
MDFFKSVFSDEPDPPTTKPESESESASPKNDQHQEENPDPNLPPNPNPNSTAGGWSFGGLIKTISAKSETVIETYRRDLQEFGSGLKKELEVAQGSLGTVSTTIDEIGSSVLKGTAQIISQGKEAILAIDHESDSSDSNLYSNNNNLNNSAQQKKYSRFDAQVSAIQGDVNTYCEEVDDLDDFKKWKSGFALDDMSEEIESLFDENGAMENIYQRVVPNSVDHETFWCRYFYRVFKLKQAEDLRANLVKRAISREEDEDLSWDVDDEEENETESDVAKKMNLKETEAVSSKTSEKNVVEEVNVAVKGDLSDKESDNKVSEQIVKEEGSSADEKGEKISESNVDEVGKGNVAESSGENVINEKVDKEKIDETNKESVGLKSDEKVSLAAKTDPSESSDFSVVSSHPSMPEEEDLGWDEIEDLSSIDDKKVTHGGSPNRADLRKRLSTAEEEEDLSWDIEEEDEPVKS